MKSLAGNRTFQLRPLVVLVALFSLSLVTADFQQDANNDFADWVARMGAEYDVTNEADGPELNSYATATGPITITVNPTKGKADFQKVQKAVDSIPNKSSTRYILLIAAGTYKEKVKVSSSKGPITFQGAGMTATTITYDDTNEKAGGTMLSASVSVSSDNFIAKDITFENTSPSPKPGAVGQQAVAFMIQGDKGAFWRVAALGYQDTLYDKAGRHYWKDSYIRGTIDFIFGNGKSYYETCYLDSVATTFGSLTAQKRETTKDDSGFSFVGCVVNGTGYSFLGRAWGVAARTVFIRTYLSAAIRPEGWDNWGDPTREKTIVFGEYECYGPGSSKAGRVPWSVKLTNVTVKPFLTIDWIKGKSWLPKGPQ